jgi:hypothetical protein
MNNIITITQVAPLAAGIQLLVGAVIFLIFAACMRKSSNGAIGLALIGAVGPMLVNSYVYMAIAVVVVFVLSALLISAPRAERDCARG